MSRKKFAGWPEVARLLMESSAEQRALELAAASGGATPPRLNEGQRRSIEVIAENIRRNGLVLADEVGMGKTRIAAELARCVIAAGGRVAIVMPPGLSFQWKEELLRAGGVGVSTVVRSLNGYFSAWGEETPAPWFEQSAVMISQMFTSHWRLDKEAGRRPWALFPELYIRWRESGGRRPRGSRDYSELNQDRVIAAADSIFAALKGELRAEFKRMYEEVRWADAKVAANYGSGGSLRPCFQKTVGLGLGAFDLVIIDEAHKNRRADGGLSVLLDSVLVRARDARVLGMTATPVELEMGQWLGTLARVGVSEESLAVIGGENGKGGVLKDYADNLERIRGAWRSSEEAREAFRESAKRFQDTLAPYLIRRDKSEDPSVLRFENLTGLHFHEYRDVRREVVVDPAGLSPGWRKAICAAESISVSSPLAGNAKARRLRLTMANGHGISTLIAAAASAATRRPGSPADQAVDEDDDPDQDNAKPNADEEVDKLDSGVAAKRAERFQWWVDLIAQAVPADGDPLYEHPAILAAVHDIEKTTAAGEKVLVFGRFTAPLAALVALLNARELLRRVAADQHWPQTAVPQAALAAVDAARRQWAAEHDNSPYPLAAVDLDATLNSRYKSRQELLDQRRSALLATIRTNLPAAVTEASAIARYQSLLDAFEASAAANSSVLSTVHRVLVETVGGLEAADDAGLVTLAFIDLVEAAQDRDPEQDDDEDAQFASRASDIWQGIEEQIRDEYSRMEGGFARPLNGTTELSTRRFLQQAFNRPGSFPQVLVAQSMVGREGLNLHKACRVVMILHLEWNPGVVEQQIGRVDRVGSLWARQIEAASPGSGDYPRIEVRPVIFKGTYDEHNWAVLRRRWDDLRAQLHGVVLPPSLTGGELSADDKAHCDRVMRMAPNFSPTRPRREC